MSARFVVLVCGGRNFKDAVALHRVMDRLHRDRPITRLVHGKCPTGADAFADLWARHNRVPVQPYPAAWDDLSAPGSVVRIRADGRPYNLNAGFDRNRVMLAAENPDRVVAFPGGGGTADMVEVAEKAGVQVWHPLAEPAAMLGFDL